MLMRVQVRPLLPSRGIPWLLQLGMAPCRGHWCACAVHGAALGEGKRGAQAAFGTGPKSQVRTVHRTVFQRLDSPKFQNTVKIEGRCRPVLMYSEPSTILSHPWRQCMHTEHAWAQTCALASEDPLHALTLCSTLYMASNVQT